MKRKNKRLDYRDHVSDLLKNPPSNPCAPITGFDRDIEKAKRRLDQLLAELQQEWKVKGVELAGGKFYVRRL